MRLQLSPVAFCFLMACAACCGAGPLNPGANPLTLPEIGFSELRIIKPNLLELTQITTKIASQPRPDTWDFVDDQGQARLPATTEFSVMCAGKEIPVVRVGFKRRVLYAPLKVRDLRIGNYLYLQLASPTFEKAEVEVKNPGGKLWTPDTRFTCAAAPLRWSPAIHANQTGYMLDLPHRAKVGFYAGSLGEIEFTASAAQKNQFYLIDAVSSKEVFRGELETRPDRGLPYEAHQHVLEADFTAYKKPGQYRLVVPGVGASFPFWLDNAVAGAFARANALGIYHQRCGTSNSMPFTRFIHGECHTAPAEVPDLSEKFKSVNRSLAQESANFKNNPHHTAPQLTNVDASLYPFVNRGPVDVRGGHHDAGDYSKYTINSAGFIHHLVLAADIFPGVGDLDNLGIPESGDGKSDILQEAKWEADFLAKMQDADGGFYFLVYPRDRAYEDNVPPDKGDPQIVFPKTTSVTAAATAALAQCASSPKFKRQFPKESALYLQRAKQGWAFLERAISKFGKDGAYQKITHYGNDFMHDDELAWAACELFLATGEATFREKLKEWLNPSDPAARKWTWWRLFDAYGCAIRSYAFAAISGRLTQEQLDDPLVSRCQEEVAAAAQDQLRRSEECAYGTSFPEETKRVRTAGWYFSGDAAFDMAVAFQLDHPRTRDARPKLLEAIAANLDYEQGCNPPNVVYLTGLGYHRQREIVNQYALNDRQILPPTGIPLGNLHGGFSWLEKYGKELGTLSFPSDGDQKAPYPIYDRWADTFNLTQEFVILNQARSLAYTSWLMARTPLLTQPWRSSKASFSTNSTSGLTLSAQGLELHSALVVWEAAGLRQPLLSENLGTNLLAAHPDWIEAEAQLPDGRRVFAVTNSTTSGP